jgi:hypothetical protein
MSKNLFKKRQVLIVTKHGKSSVIGPAFENAFDLKVNISSVFDTDTLGTFTGEINRIDDAVSTLRKKCEMGMAAENYDLAVCTEASFGPHPSVFFMPAHEEWMMLKDLKNNLEIIEKELVTDTNFSHQKIENLNDLEKFAQKIGFPHAGVILKFSNDDSKFFIKDSATWAELTRNYETYQFTHQCDAETDMRAMNNPKRMQVIEQLTKKLIAKINSLCPSCNTPGFGVIKAEKGLPCELCGSPTRSTYYFLKGCQDCDYTEKQMYPHEKTTEDPMYCDYCNP